MTTDIIVLIDFYQKERMAFFGIPLGILILAQCAYSVAFVFFIYLASGDDSDNDNRNCMRLFLETIGLKTERLDGELMIWYISF